MSSSPNRLQHRSRSGIHSFICAYSHVLMVRPIPLQLSLATRKKAMPFSKSKPIKPHLCKVTNPLIFFPMFFLLFVFFLRIRSSNSQTTLIQSACNSTLYPSLCVSSLSSFNNDPASPSLSSPRDVVLLSLSLSSQTLTAAQSVIKTLADSPSSNLAFKNAVHNCQDHILMSLKRMDWVTKNDMNDLKGTRAYLSAVLLYQYDCWSALKYVNTTHQVANAMVFVSNLTRLTSNALGMVTAMDRFGNDMSLWVPPQTERDGYWPGGGDGSDDGGLPVFPDALVADVTVCKTGDCEYKSVQDAINAAPDNAQKPFVIKIRSGTYEEKVRVPFEKTKVVFLGEGMGKTVITGKLNAQMSGVTTYNTATVGVSGDGFMAKDITFENAAGPGSHQAVAFMSDSDMSILYSVEFVGHQDTLYARSMRQFYHSCRISGTVDFIFGNSASMFYNNSIIVVPRQEGPEKGESNAVTAHGRTDPGQVTGFVFKKCTVNGSEEYVNIYRKRPGRHKVYLGRPWKEYSRTVYLNCNLEEVVRAEGWMPWRGEFALRTLFYGEFGNVGPGASDDGRVEWSSRIPEEHLDAYSVKNFLQGDQWVN